MNVQRLLLAAAISLTGWPAPALAAESAGTRSLAHDLSGTYWTSPYTQVPADRAWFSLNGDGTATAGWHDMKRSWKAIDDTRIELHILGEGSAKILRIHSGLRQADDGRLISYRIERPTPEMIAKAERGFPSPATASATPEEKSEPAVPAPKASDGAQTGSAELVKKYHDSLVFVSGAEGAGSGFIAALSGTNYLFTNAHVAAGVKGAAFKTLDGAPVRAGASAVAVGHDIFRMGVAAGGKPFPVMAGVDQNATIGDEVAVLGNAEGAGVINTILGRILGVGPNLVEVDAKFVPGNSGSPIVHLKSGEVIAVATYLVTQDIDPVSGKHSEKVRRFGFRLDSVKNWQPVNWQSFNNEAATMLKIETLTDDLIAVLKDIYSHRGRIDPGAHQNPAMRVAVQNLAQAQKNKALSQRDAAQIVQGFFSSLRFVSQTDINNAKHRLTYEYFDRKLTEQERIRSELYKGFDEAVKAIR